MKELSLNILDIAENSQKAKATLTEIILNETEDTLILEIKDNGTGMSEQTLNCVTDPFYTTRTTRNVGLGIPLLKLAAEQTGGNFKITSKTEGESRGTCVTAAFNKNHIDFTPIGDTVSSVVTLIQGHPDADFLFKHSCNSGEVSLDTRELRGILGDVPLNSYEVIKWIGEYLSEQYENLK